MSARKKTRANTIIVIRPLPALGLEPTIRLLLGRCPDGKFAMQECLISVTLGVAATVSGKLVM